MPRGGACCGRGAGRGPHRAHQIGRAPGHHVGDGAVEGERAPGQRPVGQARRASVVVDLEVADRPRPPADRVGDECDRARALGEDDLDVGQQFNNYYEETKFLAEVEVQTRRDQGMPTTIYRPSVVVGDSTTGQTQKYDGPYYALQLLLRQGRWAVMPTVGDPTLHRFNIVPSDFVIEAIATLSATDRSSGRVYNLADPRPLTVAELYATMADAVGCRMIPVPLPASLARFAIDHVPGVHSLLRIPSSTIAYLNHPTYYLTANQADLDDTGVACPPVESYMPTLVEFMRRNPDISAAAMQ